jgi:hypothetical protein
VAYGERCPFSASPLLRDRPLSMCLREKEKTREGQALSMCVLLRCGWRRRAKPTATQARVQCARRTETRPPPSLRRQPGTHHTAARVYQGHCLAAKGGARRRRTAAHAHGAFPLLSATCRAFKPPCNDVVLPYTTPAAPCACTPHTLLPKPPPPGKRAADAEHGGSPRQRSFSLTCPNASLSRAQLASPTTSLVRTRT